MSIDIVLFSGHCVPIYKYFADCLLLTWIILLRNRVHWGVVTRLPMLPRLIKNQYLTVDRSAIWLVNRITNQNRRQRFAFAFRKRIYLLQLFERLLSFLSGLTRTPTNGIGKYSCLSLPIVVVWIRWFMLLSRGFQTSSNVENLHPQIIKKVVKELTSLSSDPPEGIKVFTNEQDVTDIQATIEGPGMFFPTVLEFWNTHRNPRS